MVAPEAVIGELSSEVGVEAAGLPAVPGGLPAGTGLAPGIQISVSGRRCAMTSAWTRARA